jgi:chromosomal replication initiator protein
MNSRELWQAVLGEIEVTLGQAVYKTWFGSTSIITQEEGHIIIAVPNPYVRDNVKGRYHDKISAIIKKLHPAISSIEYKISTNAKTLAPRDTMLTANPAQPMAELTASAPIKQLAPAPNPLRDVAAQPHRPQSRFTGVGQNRINRKYTLDNFVVGPSNDLAFAACQAVASSPGVKYNPLFIYGGVGLGKTHLMQAVGNEILRHDPSKNIAYITSEQFTAEFLHSIRQGNKGRQFADIYRNLDVLIVDDIQFLGSKERTQEEFFHTFNALHQANKQVILSSDKPPKDIPNLEDRLKSRFGWGMVADIQKPDLETRSAIILHKAADRNVDLSMEVVEYLARHYQQNIRELEGVLTSILAQCELKGKEPSMAFISSLIGSVSPTARRRLPSPKLIIDKTAAYFDVQPEDIIGPRRDKDIVLPRQIAMYLMRSELNLSHPKIAHHVGGRDHTTAMHSIKKIERLIETDDDLRTEINQVKERITV